MKNQTSSKTVGTVLAVAVLAQGLAVANASGAAQAGAAAPPSAPPALSPCRLYPIAVSARSLEAAVPGTEVKDVTSGTQPGNFGWLTWSGDHGVGSLTHSLTPPGDSDSYVNPERADDRVVSVGDQVKARPGVANSRSVRDALDRLKTLDVTLPVWDEARGNGANATYRVSRFASARLLDHQLSSENRISVRFLGYRDCTPTTAGQGIAVSTAEDEPVAVTLSATDPDSTRLSFETTPPAQGTLSALSPPECATTAGRTTCTTTVTYSPRADYSGPDAFTYRASDGTSRSPEVRVSVTVTPVNDAPVAAADRRTTPRDTTLRFPAVELVANDSPGPADEAGQVLSVRAVAATGETHGTVVLDGGTVTYTPEPGFGGAATFEYTVCDDAPDQRCSTGRVDVSVIPNRAPLAGDVAASTDEDTPVSVVFSASDPDGDALSFTVVSAPAHGAVAGEGDRRSYMPSPDYSGSDSFTYLASDGRGDSNVATVSLTVRAVNDAPVANADTRTTREGHASVFPAAELVANDSAGPADEAAQALSVTAVTATAETHGTVRLDSGVVTYTATPGFSGRASFDYTVCDDGPEARCAAGRVNVSVGANQAPVAADASVATDEDTPVAVALPATDADGDRLSFAVVTHPVRGTLTGAGGSLTYTPAPDTSGSDSFTFRANDGAVDSNVATVSIAVRPVNDPPVANPDARSTLEGKPLAFSAVELLANDTAGPGDESAQTLSVTAVTATDATHGTATLVGGTVTYTPDAGFSGPASFHYTVCDDGAGGVCATGRVELSVVAQRAPVAEDVSATTPEDTPVDITLRAVDPDGDALVYSIVTPPAHGQFAPGVPEGPAFRYEPARDYHGSDTFTYRASDGAGTSNVATVSITVTPVNDPPLAAPDARSIVQGRPLSFPAAELIANDSAGPPDESGQILSVAAVAATGDSHGTVTLAGGTVTYTPDAAYSGPAAFEYRVCDHGPGSPCATGRVEVAVAANRAPTASDVSASTDEDTAVTVALPASDADGDLLSFTVIAPPAHGTLAGTGSDRTYTPAADSSGSDSFTYRASDGRADSNVATVSLTVRSVNDPPTAAPDSRTTIQGQALSFPAAELVANDSAGPPDESAQILSVTAVAATGDSHGTVTLAGGTVTYSPDAAYSGPAAFEYRVCDDGHGSPCATGRVDVSVAANRAPTAADVSSSTDEDTPAAITLAASDPDGDALTFAVVAGPSHGTLAGDGATRTYTPAADYHGPDSFTYTANDGRTDSNTATVSVAVRSGNDVPVAKADTVQTAEGQALSFPAADLVANDSPGPSDEATQSLLVSVVTATADTHGTVVLAAGVVTYTPDAAHFGPAAFDYTVCDDDLSPRCATGRVDVDVTARPNQPPQAADIAASTDEDTAAPVTLAAVDPDNNPLTFAIVAGPSHGTLTGDGATRTFTPAPDYSGTDTFTYKANDGRADSNVATVSLTVRAVNDPPTAENQTVGDVQVGTAKTISLGATDRDSATLTIATVAGPSHGTLSATAPPVCVADGAGARCTADVTYSPSAAYVGPDSFTFKASDGTAESIGATVNITVPAPRLTTVTVTPAESTLARGQTQQYKATGTFSDGSGQDVTTTVTWSSSVLAVATVSATGVVSAVDSGTATVTATRDGVSASSNVTVTTGTLASIKLSPTDPTVLVADNHAFKATGILTDGTSESLDGQVVWSSSEPAVATVGADGVARALAEGSTTITATKDTIVATTTMTVRARVGDTSKPTATITSPANNASLTSPTDIVGTASDPNFLRYVLELAPAGESTFTLLKEGTTPVTSGVLGRFDPTMLLNDLYTLRLTVFDRGGNSATASVVYQVTRDLKIGHFSLTFPDLQMPVAGFPIMINRVYDSRDKTVGDFGFGWRLDVQTLRIRANRVQGTAWRSDRSPGLFPTYSLVPSEAHKVSLTLPDGRVEEFDLVPNPSSEPLAPVRFTNAEYKARAGTLGTLRPLGNAGLLVEGAQPGPVTLLNDETFEVYNPDTFEYTSPSGERFVIGKTGVRSVTDLNGNSLTFTPTGITHSSGTGVTFKRDATNRIEEIIDPNGNTIRYEYDQRGDLRAHVDALLQRSTFTYDHRHGLLEIFDPTGKRPLRNEYDESGRLTKHIDAHGYEVAYVHDLAARQEVVIDRMGRTTLYAYDLQGNVLEETDPTRAVKKYTYDSRGNRLTETDALGKTTTFTYDGRDKVRTITDPNGHVTKYTYDNRGELSTTTDPKGFVTTDAYDTKGNLAQTVDSDGAVWKYTYDLRGNLESITDPAKCVTEYGYDAKGNLVREKVPGGPEAIHRYDSNNNRIESTVQRSTTGGRETLVTTYEYDPLNRQIKTTYADGTSRLVGHDKSGRTSSETDELGRTREYRRDTLGRVIGVLHLDGTAESYSYDPEGRRVTWRDRGGRETNYSYDPRGYLTETVQPDGAKTVARYDAAARLISETDERGNETKYEYDAGGQLVLVTDALAHTLRFTYDAVGALATLTDKRHHTTKFEYDSAARRTKTTFSDGTFQATVYDPVGRVAEQRDENGKSTRFEYTCAGQVSTVTEAGDHLTRNTYDELGNRITETDAEGRTTTNAFDARGRLISRTLPLGQVERFTYTATGTVKTYTDRNGRTAAFDYDNADRLKEKRYGDGATVVYSYTPSGKRATVTDGRGTATSTYDARDRVLTQTSPGQPTVSYSYDPHGNRRSVNVAGRTTQYGFDALNRLADITDADGGVYRYEYDENSNVTKVSYPNHSTTSWIYDDRNRFERITNARSSGDVISQYTYSSDNAGNYKQVIDHLGQTTSYEYDDAYQLTKETTADPSGATRVTSFTYDKAGNRLSDVRDGVTTLYEYDRNDRLLARGNETLKHDENGNLIERTGPSGRTTFAYDAEDRLLSLTESPATGEPRTDRFEYDADGLRVRKVVGSAETNYVIDHNTRFPQVLSESGGSGNETASYVYGHDLVSTRRGGASAYFHYDGQLSVRQITDPSQAVAAEFSYDAFGVPLQSSGTQNSYRYTGEQLDPETGLYYLRARYYEPALGRFISSDKFPGQIRVPESLHRYAYVGNQPLNNVDPSGKVTIAGISANAGAFIASAGMLVQHGFRTGTIGRVFNAFGTVSERYVFHVLKLNTNWTQFDQQARVGQRVLDFFVRVGNRAAFIEAKYSIPRLAEAMDRLVAQVEAALASGMGEVVLFTLRNPRSSQELSKLIARLGPNASRVTILHGPDALYQWMRTFFGIAGS